MHRRGFLSTLGVAAATAVAGCTAVRSPNSNDGTPTDASAPYPSLSVEADPVSDPELSATVSVVRGFDAEGPARIRIELENAGDRERTPIFGVTPPFTELWGERVDGEGRAVLVPVDRPHMARVIPETGEAGWRATDDFGINATAVQVPMAPGERIGRTYAFLAAAETDGLRAGEYRFEAREYAGDGDWGFTVVVSY